MVWATPEDEKAPFGARKTSRRGPATKRYRGWRLTTNRKYVNIADLMAEISVVSTMRSAAAREPAPEAAAEPYFDLIELLFFAYRRSEERRVGKECRSR